MLSSSPDHTITMLAHIMAFPADRPGMPQFSFLFVFVCALFGMPSYTTCKRNTGFRHHPKVFCLFASITAVVDSMRARDGLNYSFVVTVQWSFLEHVLLYTVGFVFYAYLDKLSLFCNAVAG